VLLAIDEDPNLGNVVTQSFLVRADQPVGIKRGSFRVFPQHPTANKMHSTNLLCNSSSVLWQSGSTKTDGRDDTSTRSVGGGGWLAASGSERETKQAPESAKPKRRRRKLPSAYR